MAAIADFKQQDWVKQLTQEENPRQLTKKHINPNVAFLFQDDFSIGTIHGTTAKATTPSSSDIVCVFLTSGYDWVTVMHEIQISSA